MVGTRSAGRRFFTDLEWKQIREVWVEIHEEDARTLRKLRKDYKRGSKTRRRLDIVMKHEVQKFKFDLCVINTLSEMDRIFHPNKAGEKELADREPGSPR